MSNNQNCIEKINNKILTLFKKQEKKTECLPYLFPKDVKVNPDLLFIGINPSITEQTKPVNSVSCEQIRVAFFLYEIIKNTCFYSKN